MRNWRSLCLLSVPQKAMTLTELLGRAAAAIEIKLDGFT